MNKEHTKRISINKITEYLHHNGINNIVLNKTEEETFIFSNDKKHRYFYRRILDNPQNDKHCVIIMLNPAYADKNEADDTLKNILDFFDNHKSLGFASFDIINLYSIRTPKIKDLDKYKNSKKTEIEKNYSFVKAYLDYVKNNAIIIAAWGCKYNNIAKKLFKGIECDFYCYALNKASPKHFSNQAYNRVKNKIKNLIKLPIF